MAEFKIFLKEYKKKVNEDKLLTKEEDGSAVGGGEISSPTANTTQVSDIVSKNNASVKYDDVLGHCDHEKEGYFGPHCFHRPMPIFSKPISRIPRRKKKDYEIQLTEDEKKTLYSLFEEDVKPMLQRIFQIVNNEIKSIDQELNLVYDEEYDFSSDEKKDWVAALNKEEQENINQMLIGFNLKVLFDYLDDMGMTEDDEEIECQLLASMYHELAHGLIQWFKDQDIYDFELTDREEENVAEEYAKYKLSKYTGVKKSRLQNFIEQNF